MLALTACGGGGGGSSNSGSTGSTGSVPTPTPTPTAAPSPTPSASPSYVAFDALTGDRSFQTACESYFTTTPTTYNPVRRFGDGLKISYYTSNQTYKVVDQGPEGILFGPNQLLSNRPAGEIKYERIDPNAGFDSFTIVRRSVAGTTLNYVREIEVATGLGIPRVAYVCPMGVTTLPDDVPAATTSSYTTQVMGRVDLEDSGSPSLEATVATFTVDRTTMTVNVVLNFVSTTHLGTTGNTIVRVLDTVTGTGTIDPVTGSFFGTWAPGANDVRGNFGGTFYGPQRREVGYAFLVTAGPRNLRPYYGTVVGFRAN